MKRVAATKTTVTAIKRSYNEKGKKEESVPKKYTHALLIPRAKTFSQRKEEFLSTASKTQAAAKIAAATSILILLRYLSFKVPSLWRPLRKRLFLRRRSGLCRSKGRRF